MRIGQLARKYDLSVQEIITYLEEDLSMDADLHPNYKLDESTEEKLFAYFDIEVAESAPNEEVELVEEVDTPNDQLPEVEAEEQEAFIEADEADNETPATSNQQPATSNQQPATDLTPEEEIAALDGELASAEERVILKVTKEEIKKQEAEEPKQPKEDEVIQTDKLLEMLESEEAPADLDKIKLIKAPKKELAGLKVVGKVDLPEPKKKEEKEEKEPKERDYVTERDLREYRYPKRNKKTRQQLTEAEKEQRRLKAKAKKEAYLAREEKRKKEKEAQQLKARKAAHYQQKLTKVETTQKKKSSKATAPAAPKKKEQPKTQKPKTLFGKIWRWLNAAPYE